MSIRRIEAEVKGAEVTAIQLLMFRDEDDFTLVRLMVYSPCRTRIQVPTKNRIPNLMATS